MDYDKLIERLSRYSEPLIAYKLDADFAAAIVEAVAALRDLPIEDQAMRNAANGFKADLARVTAERDAAVEDLEEIMFKGGHNIDTCHFCTNGQCYGRGGTQVCEPKWRGIKED